MQMTTLVLFKKFFFFFNKVFSHVFNYISFRYITHLIFVDGKAQCNNAQTCKQTNVKCKFNVQSDRLIFIVPLKKPLRGKFSVESPCSPTLVTPLQKAATVQLEYIKKILDTVHMIKS